MRIYPTWDKTDNSQAKKTQAWQLHYFIKLKDCPTNCRWRDTFDRNKLIKFVTICSKIYVEVRA
jgi:MepB protein